MFHRTSRRVAGWIVGLFVLGWASGASAATGLAFLKIGAGARAVGLGDAVVSQVDDATATYWNPGAIPLYDGWQAELDHNESFGGIRYEFASVTRTYGRQGLGLAFHGVWVDRMRSYDSSGEYLGDFGAYDLALSGSYGLSVRENLGVGVTLSYLREAIDVYSTDGIGFSLGAQYREVLPRTDFGLSVRNLGSSFKYQSTPFDLPMTTQGGVTYHQPLAALSGALLISIEGRKVRDEDGQLLFGTEYSYKNLARFSVGYRTGLDTEDVSLGIGLGDGRVRGQYAYVPFSENLGEQHRLAIQIRG